MNVVIFSYAFVPLNNAEAFCTTRFANGLKNAGHHVHVVTMKQEGALISQDIVDELLSADIPITSVEAERKSKLMIFFKMLRYRICDPRAAKYHQAIMCLKDVLTQYENPVLVSRAMPITSNIVAYYCRKEAKLWMAHFSDPFPDKSRTWLGTVVAILSKQWGKKIINEASCVSVTCERVLDFFHYKYQKCFEKNKLKFLVLPHIGDPFLTSAPFQISQDKPIISYCGGLRPKQYCDELLREINLLSEMTNNFLFFLVGIFPGCINSKLKPAINTYIKSDSNFSPRFASYIIEISRVTLVLDTRMFFNMSAVLPSKFVYYLFTNTPIIIYTDKKSEMYNLMLRYPEAGIFYADPMVPGDLARVMYKVLNENHACDRTGIRLLFSQQRIIGDFNEKIHRIISNRER